MTLAGLAYQTGVPPAPGRAESGQQQTASAQTAQQGAPPGEAGEQPGGLGMLFPLLLFLPLIIFLFWSSRSQQKKQQAAIAALKKGDRVITQSGLVGKLVELGDRYAKVELAPGVKVDVLKTGLLGKDNPETAASVQKK